jgi:mRNA-degrading endonuclease toxin of MazEF toxin-antitoxin module
LVAARPAATGKRKPWAPDRQEIIWIDYNPQVGREMRDVHPFLVLSPRIFNEKTSPAIGLPMTTAEYNSDNSFAFAVGKASGRKTAQTSYVLCHQPNISTGACAKPGRTLSARYPTLCLCGSANGSIRSFRLAEEFGREELASRERCSMTTSTTP